MPQHATKSSFQKGHIPWSLKPKVEKTCEQCRNLFFVKQSLADSSRFCSRVCKNEFQIGRKHSPEARAKMSASRRGVIHSGCFKKGHLTHNKGEPFSEDIKLKMRGPRPSIAGKNNPMYGKRQPESVRKAISKAQRERFANKEIRQELSQRSMELWQNPDFVAKVIKGRATRPTEPERILISILGKHLPEFKYNGNFDQGVMLNYLIPDFVNMNGNKELIEVFGDYFHSPRGSKKWHRSELGRIMAYNSVGYKCLILWEHELKTLKEEEIVTRVKLFFRR